MKQDAVIQGPRIILRKLKLSDAPDIYKNINEAVVVRWTLTIPHPYPKKGAVEFIRLTWRNIKNRKSYNFGIVLKETSRVIGGIGLVGINHKHKNAELGYWLGRRYWNKGIMTEAVKAVLGFGFRTLKLHRIGVSVLEPNIASVKVIQKSGFRPEGIKREANFISGKWCNNLVYGMLRNEWLKKHSARG